MGAQRPGTLGRRLESAIHAQCALHMFLGAAFAKQCPIIFFRWAPLVAPREGASWGRLVGAPGGGAR
jgi:hypothetical protein